MPGGDDVVIGWAERMLTNIATHYDYPLSKKIVQEDVDTIGLRSRYRF